MRHLQRFIDDAEARVAAGAYHLDGLPLLPRGSLREALDKPAAIIAELKPRSPSEGVLLRGDPRWMLEEYVAGRAVALSILTDADHFGGSLELLRTANEHGLPVLMKDFIIDTAQIRAAAHHGASAVLLIERILEPAQRDILIALAHALRLEVVLEVFDDEDWESARYSQADIIGVNQRDLDTLELDAERQLRILQEVRRSDRPGIALSGIGCREDRVRAQRAGARGVLVGTSLMRHRYPRLALRALRRPLLKICGITNQDDLDKAVAACVDMIGVVVLSASPRSVSLRSARQLVSTARQAGVTPVMVTSHADPEEVYQAARHVGPDIVQWHQRDPGLHGRLRDAGIGLIHGIQPHEAVPMRTDGIVLDAPGMGGSGDVHDWDTAAITVAAHPNLLSLIAGGLEAGNVQEALAKTGAWGADASSRLESRPGHKDGAKLEEFVAAAWSLRTQRP